MEGKCKVLIVEDQAMTAILYKKRLHRIGYQICGPVPSGEEAIEVANKEKPDLVLMDINLLGKMDGIEAAEKIFNNNNTKIIFMTGYANEEIKKRAMALNPVAYLLKPFNFDELDSLIRSAFE
jgi:CheY-like chemotaxis protein